jgi:Holliday junction resolvase RusA-like endonuclease
MDAACAHVSILALKLVEPSQRYPIVIGVAPSGGIFGRGRRLRIRSLLPRIQVVDVWLERSWVETSLGRKREPVPCSLPFTYWVFGRPVSTRNDDNHTPRALPAWRSKVNSTVDAEVANLTKGRGFELISDRVEIRVVWLSTDPFERDQPDVDNMLKPLIDALNGRVIGDDRQVHRILAEKTNVNFEVPIISEISAEIVEDPDYRGEIIVVRVSDFDPEYRL